MKESEVVGHLQRFLIFCQVKFSMKKFQHFCAWQKYFNMKKSKLRKSSCAGLGFIFRVRIPKSSFSVQGRVQYCCYLQCLIVYAQLQCYILLYMDSQNFPLPPNSQFSNDLLHTNTLEHNDPLSKSCYTELKLTLPPLPIEMKKKEGLQKY